jgi:FixJ family two-component response regulator
MSVQSHTRIWEALTTRRVQVAAGLADGKTEKQIAREFGIEETTVKDHVKHLREIFGEPDARGVGRFWRTYRSEWHGWCARVGGLEVAQPSQG